MCDEKAEITNGKGIQEKGGLEIRYEMDKQKE
jgi:hypothetical protein